MNKNYRRWTVPVTGVLLMATGVSAEQNLQTYLNSTNRVTLSLRFGLNISGKFKNTGGSLAGAAGNGRRTGHGDNFNYDDGYVLTDISGNAGGQTWYWGNDSASQVNASGANSIDFHRDTALGVPSQNPGDDSPYVGAEVTYDYEVGVKEGWHHLRYGLEAAINFMPISFSSGGLYNATLSRLTDTFGYTTGTTPPGAPYAGSFEGPGFVLNTPANNSVTTLVPGATFLAQQHFDANLWGFRLGPYVEMPLTEKLSLHLSGGLALGLLDGEASWKETITLPAGGGSTTKSGGGHDLDLLAGYYIGLSAAYQFNDDWSVEAGVQFQDLGTYDHDFGGRTVELDLSKSIFIHAGFTYHF